ncbi:MAG: hypothetical protein PF448_07080 [Bacteroidales bacterium]|jgi:hypothetical protein|nr:hypothetical protein [Bacteroidales bacterium]
MKAINGQEAYEKLQKLLIDKKDKLRIMERQVDIEVQMAYFEKGTKIKLDLPDLEHVLTKAEDLFDEDVDLEAKRTLLNQLASFEEVKCYRILEKYMKQPDKQLVDWSYLAYQESLMGIESSLTDEDMVYISSGLGGKANKLRYFVVMMTDDKLRAFSQQEQSFILKEIKYQFDKFDAEFEEHNFYNAYFMFSCLIPIDISIGELFHGFIQQINEFGALLSDNFLITNVKRMSVDEVEDFIEKRLEDGGIDDEEQTD